MTTQSMTTFAARDIRNSGQLATAIELLQEYYAGSTPPPLPKDIRTMVPCTLVVTETWNAERTMRTGTVTITDPRGHTLFEQHWQPGSR